MKHRKTPVRLETSKRFLGLLAAPAFMSLIALSTLPAVARSVDASGWGALAIGQSVGTVGAVVGAGGWGLVGGPTVALAEPGRRTTILRDSYVVRIPLTVVSSVVAACAAALILSGVSSFWLGMQACAASALASLSSAWYFTGSARVRDLWRIEVIPKSALLIGCAVALGLGAPVAVYPAAIGLGYIVSFALTWFTEIRGQRFPPRAGVQSSLQSQATAIWATCASSAYASSGPALVALGGGTHAAAFFSSVDRLYKIAVWGVDSAVNATQPWIRGPSDGLRSKIGLALRVHLALAITCCAVFSLLGPTASRILFGPSLAFGYAESAVAGAALAIFTLTLAVVRLLVLPSGRRGAYLLSTVVSAAVGIPAIIVGSALWGSLGGWAGVLITGAVGLAMLLKPSAAAFRALASDLG